MQDGQAFNHLVYMQDSNLTNPKPNPNPDCLIRTNQTHISHANRHFASKKYNNFCWSAVDLHCPANSQNWQIVQDGPVYNQCVNYITCGKNDPFHARFGEEFTGQKFG